MFGALYSVDGTAADALIEVAADFTPRFELHDPDEVVLDLTGLERLFGSPREIGNELCRAAAERQVHARVVIAATYTTARLLALAEREVDVVVVERGAETTAIAPLRLALLARITNMDTPPLCTQVLPAKPQRGLAAARENDLLTTFHRWGIRTLGGLAALPADAVAARLGANGTRWQCLARGEDPRPLRPETPKERFEQVLDLEWPIEGFEPLSFVLGRLLEPLTVHLDRRGRGAAVLHLRLHLVTRTVHERSLQLPVPMRDARTFRTLLLLDLESHPPSAAIDRVVVAVDPTPARIVQFSLLTRPLPSAEQLSTLAARLAALMGEDRCGSPVAVDSWQPGAFGMKPFNPGSGIGDPGSGKIRTSDPDRLRPGSPIPDPRSPCVALRRFRIPIPARVRVEHDRPLHVTTDRGSGIGDRGSGGIGDWGSGKIRTPDPDRLRISDPSGSRIPDPRSPIGGRVTSYAGPWRTSGQWWHDQAVSHPRSQSRPAPRPEQTVLDSVSSGLRSDVARSADTVVKPLQTAPPWDRDEWDVTLSDGATYRLFRDRTTSAWFLEGSYD